MDFELIGMWVASWILIEFIKSLIGSKDSRMIKEIHESLEKTDSSGRPLIYFPTSLEKENQKLLEQMLRIVIVLDSITKTLEKISEEK